MGYRKRAPIVLNITTGDQDGIGPEVTFKALRRLGPLPGVRFRVFVGSRTKLPRLSEFKVGENLAWLPRPESPAHWVEEATHHCLRHSKNALVTAPLSKTTIVRAGLKDIGHTEILARLTHRKTLHMGFLGQKFNVLLATGHIPLKNVTKEWNVQTFRAALRSAKQMQSILPLQQSRKPIALVGLNPHAGEDGLLGTEEAWVRREIQKHKGLKGPLVPDSAFLPQNWGKYSLFIVPYHDQGLIPFKMIHGFNSGVHLTLGLPFVRTSVDHGTAKEIFGKNLAEAGSMIDAIETAVELVKRGAR
ncbi:MAG: 4-hydroxythreonine-4-phosphate dehydrogenase PdxA [Bdellovibrionales bacterium]